MEIMNQIRGNKISHASIRQLIKEQMENGITCFTDLKSTCPEPGDLSNYHLHERDFYINKPLQVVWRHYMNTSPAEAWKGKMLSFGLMVSKNENSVMYTNERYGGTAVGQVFYVNLNFLGLINVAVAHELIRIDNEQHFFELSYVVGGKSTGKQHIAFFSSPQNSTQIVHTTHYRGKSKFRDKFLYPYFHAKAIAEYHGNMARSLRGLG